MKKKKAARIVNKRKQQGKSPFYDLSGNHRVVARIQLDRNHVLQKGKRQPSYRAVVVMTARYLELFKDDELSFHIWNASDREGFDGEVRIATRES